MSFFKNNLRHNIIEILTFYFKTIKHILNDCTLIIR